MRKYLRIHPMANGTKFALRHLLQQSAVVGFSQYMRFFGKARGSLIHSAVGEYQHFPLSLFFFV